MNGQYRVRTQPATRRRRAPPYPSVPALGCLQHRRATRGVSDVRTVYGMLDAVNWRIRKYRPSDEEPVVVLSLRAGFVFASRTCSESRSFVNCILTGGSTKRRLSVVVLVDPAMEIWITEDGSATGFVAATLNVDGLIGEVYMLAVDPDAQDQGVGSALTETATNWLRTSGMRVAMIDTGGDPGHAPARRVYEKANYTALPIVRYFKAL